MSKNYSGYMGPQIGKLGPAVGFKWKNKNVFRAYNPWPKNPNTQKQQDARQIFGAMASLSRLMSTAINFGFKFQADAEGTTTRGLFMKKNKGVITFTGGTKTIDYSSIKVAEGSLASPVFGTPDFDTPGQMDISYESNVTGAATKDDQIIIIAVNPSRDEAVVGKGTRGTGGSSINIPLPSHWAGTAVHVYGFARATVEEPTFIEDYNGNIYPGQPSNSFYLGTGTVS
jgi:hypothetical protein